MPGFDEVDDNGGVVVHDFSQTQTLKKLADRSQSALGMAQPVDESTKDGVCHAFSTLWIIQSAKGKDFWSTIDSPQTLAFIKQGQHTEAAAMKVAAAAVGSMDKMGNFDTGEVLKKISVMNQFGMMTGDQKAAIDQATKAKENWSPHKIQETTGMAKTYSPKVDNPVQLASALTKQEGYCLLSVHYGTGGHTMAMYNMPDKGVQFMDPNYGEAMFSDPAQFERWLARHLETYQKSGGPGPGKKVFFTSYKNPVAPTRPEMGGSTLPVVTTKLRADADQRVAEEMARAEAQLGGMANIANGRDFRRVVGKRG